MKFKTVHVINWVGYSTTFEILYWFIKPSNY